MGSKAARLGCTHAAVVAAPAAAAGGAAAAAVAVAAGPVADCGCNCSK